jgi:hypothetical protein
MLRSRGLARALQALTAPRASADLDAVPAAFAVAAPRNRHGCTACPGCHHRQADLGGPHQAGPRGHPRTASSAGPRPRASRADPGRLGRACPAADERQASWADDHRRAGSGSHLPEAGLADPRSPGTTSPRSGHSRASCAGSHRRGTASFHRYDAYRVLSLRGAGSVRFRRPVITPVISFRVCASGSCLAPGAAGRPRQWPSSGPAVAGLRQGTLSFRWICTHPRAQPWMSSGPQPAPHSGISASISGDLPVDLRRFATMRPPAAGNAPRLGRSASGGEGSNSALTSGELGHLAHKAMPLSAARKASQSPCTGRYPLRDPQPSVSRAQIGGRSRQCGWQLAGADHLPRREPQLDDTRVLAVTPARTGRGSARGGPYAKTRA